MDSLDVGDTATIVSIGRGDAVIVGDVVRLLTDTITGTAYVYVPRLKADVLVTHYQLQKKKNVDKKDG